MRRKRLVSQIGFLLTLTAAGVGMNALGGARAVSGSAGTINSVAGSTVDRQYGYSGDGGPASSAQLYHPRAIAIDGADNAYIADTLNQRIRKVDPAGTITTVAGNGTAGFAGDGGTALQAALNQPHGVAVDPGGNLYIADSANHRIRRVDGQGMITTVAGNGTPGAAGDDGPASAAQLKDPKTMAIDAAGHLYIADTGNNRIRRIDLGSGVITTVAGVTRAGAEGDGGPAIRARLNSPRGLWVVPAGTIYIADTDNQRIRKVDASGTITTVAGTGTVGFSGDGGPAASAQLNDPRAVSADSTGNLYIGEELGQRIRKIDPSGTITTIAGNGTAGFSGDGGPAGQAQFDHIRALSVDSGDNLWIADTFNNRVRVIFSGSAGSGQTPPSTSPPSSPPATSTPTSRPPASPPTSPSPPRRSGYWMLGSDGRIYAFGDAKAVGDASSLLPPGAKAVHVEPTPAFKGYWILDDHGGVFSFGDATFAGKPSPDQLAPGEKVTSLSATPSGRGYWIFTSKGRALPFGDAARYGDMSAVNLNGPVLGSVATPSGRGYYMVASDGGVFAFGDARFRGSMGNKRLNAPVQSLVPDAGGAGYWLVASDGGIFAFGSAPFRGSMGDKALNKPVVGMVRYGSGYLMVAADGGIFNFSDRPFSGSLGDRPPARPVVSVATLDAP